MIPTCGRFPVKVIPNASKTELAGTSADGLLRVRVNAAPDKGSANRALVAFLSKEIGRKVRIVKGMRSRNKIIEVIP